MEFDDGDPEPEVEGIPLAEPEPDAAAKPAAKGDGNRKPVVEHGRPEGGSATGRQAQGRDDAVAQFLLDLKLGRGMSDRPAYARNSIRTYPEIHESSRPFRPIANSGTQGSYSPWWTRLSPRPDLAETRDRLLELFPAGHPDQADASTPGSLGLTASTRSCWHWCDQSLSLPGQLRPCRFTDSDVDLNRHSRRFS